MASSRPVLFRQRQIEADIAEELETHRQMARDRALKDGTALADALREPAIARWAT